MTHWLGAGGMGTVYRGRSPGGREVAIKVVRPEFAAEPGFRARFRREIDLARRVGGFWTAPVVDADPDAEAPWVASAYLAAPTLAEVVAGDGPLPADDVRRLGAGLAEALAAIHGLGVVHRDLKPSNILMTPEGQRVIDFGIARAFATMTATATASGRIVGTAGFMSPEQAQGEAVEPPADVFALGAVLVYAATGTGPFGEGPVPALLYRVVNETPSLDGLPESLRSIAGECLAKDPAKRPEARTVLATLASPAEPAPDPSFEPAIDPHPGAAPVPTAEDPLAEAEAAAHAATAPVPKPAPTEADALAEPDVRAREPVPWRVLSSWLGRLVLVTGGIGLVSFGISAVVGEPSYLLLLGPVAAWAVGLAVCVVIRLRSGSRPRPGP